MSTSAHLGYQAMLQSWPPDHICTGLTELPLARPTRMVVAADPPAEPYRDDVLANLSRSFQALGAPARRCHGPSWLGCWTTDDPTARNVMVVLAHTAPPSAVLEDAVDECVHARGFEALGVLRAGENPDSVLPSALRRLNALEWHRDPVEVVPEIVDTILLDAEDRRIFVSYSHYDGIVAADRVFELLATARFDVFLDRFRLPPGRDFVERIEDEIVDKSMVVVVETPAAAVSHWVRHEVALAAKRGLGLAAVNLGHAPETPGVDEEIRFRGGSDEDLVSFLLEQHRVQLAQRRESLRESVWQALTDAGADPADIAENGLGFELQVGSHRRVVGVSVRPADLHRFRVVQEHADPDEVFLVHPPPALHSRRRDIGWLSDKSDVLEVDEGRINEAASTMSTP